MSESSTSAREREQRVDEAIAAWLAAVDRGEPPVRESFLTQHADIAAELRAFFRVHDRLATWPPARDSKPGQGASPATSAFGSRTFGDYELVDELARGGMGVVYRARQVSLNRPVALKMILAGALACDEEVRRFRAEAEAAAQLDHPGIVPVYEVGVQDGQHFFSMPLVLGCSLAEMLRDGPLPERVAAWLLATIADALAHAHRHGVIHRDLKPTNILLEYAATAPDAATHSAASVKSALLSAACDGGSLVRPRVADFGLAKRLTGGLDLTGSGQIVGTPSYMAPEQARSGTARSLGPAADLYSLGAILYHMLTGRPPHQAATPLETLALLRDAEPVFPRLLNRSLSREIETICLRCLAREPGDRYASADELHEELLRYLRGEPLRTPGLGFWERVARSFAPRQAEEHFRDWGLGLMAFGLVILVSHVAIQFWEGTVANRMVDYFLWRGVMFAGLIALLVRFRRLTLLPLNSAERRVWVVWLAYLASIGAMNTVRWVLGHDQRESYALLAVLAGFGFLAMGGHVWRGSYVIGTLFLLSAPGLARFTDWAPLASGVLWGGALFTFGWYYSRNAG